MSFEIHFLMTTFILESLSVKTHCLWYRMHISLSLDIPFEVWRKLVLLLRVEEEALYGFSPQTYTAQGSTEPSVLDLDYLSL